MASKETIPVFPLTQSQQNIWALECAYEGTSINNICTTIRISGKLDFRRLEQSIHLLLKADPSLRTQICLQDSVPMQYRVPYREQSLAIYDFTYTDQEGIAGWETGVSREHIPLFDAPLYQFYLFRSGEHEGGVLVKIHHIISDGWSQMLICNRIAGTYLELLEGKESSPEQAPDYFRYVQEEQAYLASKAYEKDRRYWEQAVTHSGEPSVLKTVKSAAISPMGKRISFSFPQVLNHAVYSYCVRQRVAPFAVFYMALAIYFRRVGGAVRFTIGTPVVNRTDFIYKQSSGMFVNTLPFYNEIDDEWSLNQFNESMMEQWYELLRHQRFPFAQIRELARKSGREDDRLFHIALSYQDSRVYESENASVAFRGCWHYSGYQAEQLCIHLSNMEDQRHYRVDYDYLTQLFSEKEIRRLHENLENILLEALENPDRPLRQLAVLGREEKEQVLYTFNRTACTVKQECLYEVFAAVVRENPERVALISEGRKMTYRQLDQQAAMLSEKLESVFGKEKGIAAILLPRSHALFIAIMGVIHSGNAYLLLSTEQPSGRLCKILKDSRAGVLITRTEWIRELGEQESLPPVLEPETPGREPEGVYPGFCPVSGEELAYVVYTSGSTGVPKGVEITQKNLLNFARGMSGIYAKGAVLSVCSVGFDAFMIESTVAMLNGCTVILPGEEELESPRRLAELMRGYGAGFLSITPSRLSAFLKDARFAAALRMMESIVCGGEAFPGELLKKLQACTHARIYNQYGPSETAVGVTLKELNDSASITAGKPMANCRLYVLDPWMNPLPAGVYGELYIGGLSVGRGYRGDEKLTREKFVENPFESGERIYATGDAACWTADGEIVLAGRFDRQVKLRGLRVEPREVSDCIAAYPDVREAAARVLELNGQMVLAAYYCADREISQTELLTYAAANLPRYMIPSVVMRISELPLLASGKVDEARLPRPLPENRCAQASEGTVSLVLEIFARVLKRNEIGVDSDYFLYGGNSLNAMEVLGELEEKTGCLLRVTDLYALRTPRRLAQHLQEVGGKVAGKTQQWKLQPAAVRSRYPLSPIQEGIYVQSLMDEDGLAYHMPGAFVPEQPLDARQLERALVRLIEAEPILRTRFVQEADGVFARVEPQVLFGLEMLQGESLEEAAATLIRPMQLSQAPLLRAGLYTAPDGTQAFILDVHHIVGDGLSTPLMLQRLEHFYRGTASEAPAVSYLDYVCSLEQTSAEEKQRDAAYWKEHLTPLPEPLMLPVDHSRGKCFDYRGEWYEHPIAPRLAERCEEACREQGISLYMLFLAAYGILLASISGKQRLVVGTPVSQRRYRQLQEICGPFINTMPLLLKMDGEESCREFLQTVKEEVNEMLSHPRCTLEEMISMLKLPRSFSGNPLYQAAFSMRPFETGTMMLGGAPIHYRPLHTGTTKSELFLEVVKEGKQLSLSFEYACSLFEKETIAFYGRCLETIVEGLVSGRDCSLNELSRVSQADRIELLELPNSQLQPYVNLPLQRLITAALQRNSRKRAVIWHGEEIDCQELLQSARRIGGGLCALGVQKGERIGLAFSRTPQLLSAMLGILLAGAAYVPMAAALPAGRLRYMAESAEVKRILCDSRSRQALTESKEFSCIAVEELQEPEYWEAEAVGGEELIHVLFTSGSTGRPKGVMITQRNVANLYSDLRPLLQSLDGPVLCTANVMFDIFLVESLFPLALGLPVVLADEEEMLLPWRLAALIEQHQVRFLQMTASRLSMCLGNADFQRAASCLKLVIVGGEALTAELVEKFYSCCKGRLINMYGPTEATVCSTMAEVRTGEALTIGRPLPNYRVYLLDEQQNPVMPTARGELYLAGEGISAGYAGHPELTREAFFVDPWYPGRYMYKSGDMGRLRVDGSIDFLGRLDDQIKIGGQRVEISEITNVMLESGLAEAAAVFPLEQAEGLTQLAACYVPVSGRGADRSAMEAYLRQCLPSYMIPTRMRTIDQMPLNENGKTDLRVLREWTCREQRERRSEGADALTQRLLSVWQEVLGTTELSAEQSFFEQGGTSLGALNVLSHYFNEGMEMTMAQFYETPTACGQARILAGRMQKERTAGVAAAEEAEYPQRVPETPPLQCYEKRAVFLTGATGFFGAHLLYELLQTKVPEIFCLVRGQDKQRLAEALSWYFGAGFVSGMGKRIRVIFGDLEQPRFGMSREAFDSLADYIDTIYHCAADVRHYAADEAAFLACNVQGTETVIRLAEKGGAVLHHMSTASISGDYLPGAPQTLRTFTEQDFSIGQNWEDNLYIRSKFLAEAAVYRAVSRGLKARVYRLGQITARQSDCVFQRNPQSNEGYLLLQAIRRLGELTDVLAQLPVDQTPVDWCAQAVLALEGQPGTTWHLVQEAPLTLWQLLQEQGESLQLVSEEAFERRLQEEMNGSSRTVLAPLMDFWMRIRHRKQMICLDSSRTGRCLEAAGFFEGSGTKEKQL